MGWVGKHRLIKDYMTGNVETMGGNMEAHIPLMFGAITVKHTRKRAELKFVGVVGAQERVA